MNDPLREADLWLTEAEMDLEVARTLSDRYAARACFHAQQAAEKALKAILYAAGERPVLGHSLSALGEEVAERDASYETIKGEVAKLDRFYIPTRYPNGLPQGGLPSKSFDAADAESAIATAEAALHHARAFVEAKLVEDPDAGPAE